MNCLILKLIKGGIMGKRTTLLFLVFGLVLLMSTGDAFSETYFKKTECQIHADINRVPPSDHNDIWTLTAEHYSEWKYGDTFLFMDLETQPTFSQTPATMYFEIAPRFSLDKILKQELISSPFLGEVYLAFQYNGADVPFIPTSWLAGVSVDFLGQPNYGFSNISVFVKDCDRKAAFDDASPYQNDTSWQVTFVWGQPFNLGPLQMEFNGFLDYWQENSLFIKDKTYRILLTEPQLRLKLSSFAGKDNFLSNSVLGTEIEISHHFFGENDDWRINPTLFFAVVF
jgi:nucleoside-specific outer membrane channel protein Tsx